MVPLKVKIGDQGYIWNVKSIIYVIWMRILVNLITHYKGYFSMFVKIQYVTSKYSMWAVVLENSTF